MNLNYFKIFNSKTKKSLAVTSSRTSVFSYKDMSNDWWIPNSDDTKLAGDSEIEEELQLRKENASVRDAWEQYQIVLKLTRK